VVVSSVERLPFGGRESFDPAPDWRREIIQPVERDHVERAHQIRPVILGHVRTKRERLRNVGVIGLVVFAFDGVDMDPVIAHQVSRDVVLSRERIGGAQGDLGSRSPQRMHQVGGFSRDVEAGGELDAPERLLLAKAGSDLSEHRHRSLGPLGATLSLVGELQVLDVVFGCRGPDILNGHVLLSGRPIADPSRDRAAPR
jgi:hypothetical protein